jgi:LCP family protein required for cell wall assembly
MSRTPQAFNLLRVLKRAKPQEPYTVLLLGADYRPQETSWRADTIILAKVDPQEKKVWMLSIPRDTRVEIPGHGVAKINTAHALGGKEHGPELMVKTVEKFTGLPVNHYAEINFHGFQLAVDQLGGVWVDVPTEINDWKAASHSPGHRAKHVDAGYQKLDGEHALTFVRSRDYADADFTRIKNQQAFFKAMADQLAANPTKVPRTVQVVSRYVITDMSTMSMLKSARALRSMGKGGINAATVDGEWRSP